MLEEHLVAEKYGLLQKKSTEQKCATTATSHINKETVFPQISMVMKTASV